MNKLRLKKIAVGLSEKEYIKAILNNVNNSTEIINTLNNEGVPNIFIENKKYLIKEISKKVSKKDIEDNINSQKLNKFIIESSIALCKDIWKTKKETYSKTIKTSFDKLMKENQYLNIKNDDKISKAFYNFVSERVFDLISTEINETKESVNNNVITDLIKTLSDDMFEDFLKSNKSGSILEKDNVELYVNELLSNPMIHTTKTKRFEKIIKNKYLKQITDKIYDQYTQLANPPKTKNEFYKVEFAPIQNIIIDIIDDIFKNIDKIYNELYKFEQNDKLFSPEQFKKLFQNFVYNEIDKNIIPSKESIIQYFNDIKNRMDKTKKNDDDLKTIEKEVMILRNTDNKNTKDKDTKSTNDVTNDVTNNNNSDETLVLNQEEINNKINNSSENNSSNTTNTTEDTTNTSTEDNPIKPGIYSLQYIQSKEVSDALEELIEQLQNIDGVPLNITKNDKYQFSKLKKLRKIFALKTYAKFNKFAVDDFFAFIRNLGFDQKTVQDNICANYYEGNSVTELNGKVDTIFYYPNATTAKSRLRKIIAEGVDSQPLLLPASEQQLLLPPPNSLYYAVLSDANPGLIEGLELINIDYNNINNLDGNIKAFTNFPQAEEWILASNKSIMQREIINQQFISGNIWTEYEKKLYEEYYKNGPKNDVQQIETINITIPDNPEAQKIYNEWFTKYKKLFNRYESQSI